MSVPVSDDELNAVLAQLRQHRAAGEERRTLAEPVIAALIDAGLFRLGVPRSLGGLEPSPRQILDLLEALTDADVCGAWFVWNNLLPALLGRQLPPQVRAELFGDRREVFGNSTRAQGDAVATADGYRVSGRWSLVSGCLAATRFALLCSTAEGARFVFLRRDDVSIIDTWSTSGLRATGSHDVAVHDVWVPASHTVSFVGPAPAAEGPLDHFPTTALMAAGAATMLLGLADIGVAELRRVAGVAAVTDGRPQAATRPAMALGVARAGTEVRAARLLLRQSLDQLWAAAAQGPLPPEGFATLYEAVDFARRCAMAALRATHELAGTAAVYTDQALERANRDALVMVQHIIFDPLWAEQAGRVRLGLAPTHPLFTR